MSKKWVGIISNSKGRKRLSMKWANLERENRMKKIKKNRLIAQTRWLREPKTKRNKMKKANHSKEWWLPEVAKSKKSTKIVIFCFLVNYWGEMKNKIHKRIYLISLTTRGITTFPSALNRMKWKKCAITRLAKHRPSNLPISH